MRARVCAGAASVRVDLQKLALICVRARCCACVRALAPRTSNPGTRTRAPHAHMYITAVVPTWFY